MPRQLREFRSLLDPRVAWAVTSAGMALVLVADGSLWWAAVRVTAVGVLTAAGATASGRAGRAAEIVLGTVAAGTGGTIAFAYLGTAGLSVKAAGGLLSFVGGLALLLHGSYAALRATRRWHRLLAIPIVVVAGYGLVVPLCFAVFATNVPRPHVGVETPRDRGLHFVDASFRTRDGVLLSGWYIPATNRAAVVLLHGASSTRSAVLDQAVVLSRAGFGVLLYDARGHGRSAGRAMEFGWYGDLDVSAAVGYLERRPDVDPERIGAVGMSMGGEQAIGAMAADNRLKVVVGEGATNRTFADKHWLADEYGLRGRLQLGVEWLTYGFADLLTDARPPTALDDAVRAAAPRPVLLIAAGDLAEEQKADEAIRAASPDNVELWVVPDAKHTGGLHTAPVEWTARVTEFLARALLK